MTADPVGPQSVTVPAADGRPLAGRLFQAQSIQGCVLIAGATAVPQRFYSRFAAWLASHGYATLTFDYRGIAESLNGQPVRAMRADLVDWGSRDIPGALSWFHDRYPNLPLCLLGHSAGGQMLGLLPNHALLDRVVTVAASTGYVPREKWPTRWLARFVFQVYGPTTTRLLGYLPARRIRLGEDLPAGVASQWARWCLSPGYAANGRGRDYTDHWHAQFAAPVLALSATDDPIATAPNVEALWAQFPSAEITIRRLAPSDYGLVGIGHMNFFRASHQALWPFVLAGLSG